MNKGLMAAVANRREAIKEKLQKNPGVIFSYKQIKDEFNLSAFILRTDMAAIMESDSNIVKANGEIYYKTTNPPTIHEVKKPERYSETKNIEGYSDPTASSAIKGLLTISDKTMIMPRPGDVWNVKRSNSTDYELYIVLAVNVDKQTATCIKYSKEDLADTCDICLFTKPLKYFVSTSRSWTMPLSFMTKVKERIGEFLDIPVKEVEKIVEVEKEVPVEVEKPAVNTGLYTKAEVDLMLLKQKADIYEECFRMMAGERRTK